MAPTRSLRLAAAWLALAATVAGAATGSAASAVRPAKKLIEWGWDEPDPAFMRAHAPFMDAVGFDGVFFHLTAARDGRQVDFAREAWSARPFAYPDFSRSVADLEACRFARLTHNFVRVNIADVGWFDDAAFAVVAHNAALLARIARETGAAGIMFDVEAYGSPVWCYGLSRHEGRTYPEYTAMVRRRGGEFVRALDAEYPGITVLLTYGYTVRAKDPVVDRSWGTYGLLEDFLDGMFESAAPDTTIVDAFEQAYGFRKRSQFRDAYRDIHQGMLRVTGVPEAYRRHAGAAFGVWMDNAWPTLGWHTDDVQRNYFTPDELAYALASALQVSDEYVWVYSEKARWWTLQDLPAAYRAALRQARRDTPDADARMGVRPIPPAAPASAGPEARLALPLPARWEFRTDPAREGTAGGWFGREQGAGGWRSIDVGAFWDAGGAPYAGTAWYRVDWDTPAFAVPAGRRAVLRFGAAAEQATVWINGAWAGAHAGSAERGWDEAFSVPAGALQPGQRNRIVVKVTSATPLGGLWKPVQLGFER